ncbi:unnamed protein product, partial [Pylaiella littoralis]
RQLLLYLLYALPSVRVRLCARAEFCFFTRCGMEVTALRDALGQHDEEHDSGVSPSPTRMVRLFG